MPVPTDEQEITSLGAEAQAREVPKGWEVKLRVMEGVEPGRDYPITSVPVTLGRDTLSGISFPDPKMSRQHAALVQEGSEFVLKDLGSTNGTFLNDKRIKQAVLMKGDRIRLGGTVFEFIFNRPGADPAGRKAGQGS